MKKIKALPFSMTIVSLLYFIYVVSSGNSKMIGDEVGGDPGGMLLPLVLSIFMFIGFGYLTFKERPDSSKKLDSKTRSLFIITLITAVLYVALHSILGFVLTSVLLIYTLASTFTTLDDKCSLKNQILVGLVTLASSLVVYTIFRKMTRMCLRLGRKGAIPAIFGNSNVTALLSLIIVTIFLVLFALLVYKKIKNECMKHLVLSGIVSYAAALYLYIVFKQFFMVSLAPGIINW